MPNNIEVLSKINTNKSEKIENLIYEIRGKQVMLVSDVARIYNSETKVINQVVKRNFERFPEAFCFQLNKDEYMFLRSQIVTSKEQNNIGRGGNRYLPYVFTEYGIIMLSGLLKSEIAVEVNIKVINAFVNMRKYISSNLIEQKFINSQVIKNTENIKLLQESFQKFEEKIMKYILMVKYMTHILKFKKFLVKQKRRLLLLILMQILQY